ncbi:MAG TPA: FkbM family methyltransferase [Candidatus Sulfotelmatobacter sp.]|nr:FkbM family methyltransferase [Candidatus Sulfotelmatobacter sp.]
MILESKTIARSLLRKAKLTGVAHRIRMLWHRGDYEDRFSDALLGCIAPDDCVWDVGANVGYYTERLSRLASHVIAFEPVPENYSQIESRMLPNVQCCQTALGDVTGEVTMSVNGPFSSIASATHAEIPTQSVAIARGDDLTSLRPPSVVKIDVEGYELEVIQGMHRILRGVRALFVEVHFQILEDRGMPQGPSQLVNEIRKLGFSDIKWPDASHISAFRPYNEEQPALSA